METEQKDKLIIEFKGMMGVLFSINGESKLVDSLNTLREICDTVEDLISWYEHWGPYFVYYQDYSEAVVLKDLKAQEMRFDKEWSNYSIGENFAQFMRLSFGDNPAHIKFPDNSKAAEILKREYKNTFGKNTLQFDPDSSHCYVYTKDKEEAVRFKMWVYHNYILPFISPYLAQMNTAVQP
jgi:hypothetical protein